MNTYIHYTTHGAMMMVVVVLVFVGDNVNCLQLVLSLRLYAFALVFCLVWCMLTYDVWFRARFLNLSTSRALTCDSKKAHRSSSHIKYYMAQCVCPPGLLRCILQLPSRLSPVTIYPPLQPHYKFPFVIHNCTKRIVNKFIERVSRSCTFLSRTRAVRANSIWFFSHSFELWACRKVQSLDNINGEDSRWLLQPAGFSGTWDLRE